MLDIVDKPGKISKAEIRTYFEGAVNGTPALKANTPLGIVSLNGEFSHYADPETDTMWLGFALGMRCAERVQTAKNMTPRAELTGDEQAQLDRRPG